MTTGQARGFEQGMNTAHVFFDYMDAVFVYAGKRLGATEGVSVVATVLGCTQQELNEWLESEHVASGMC